MQCYLTKCDVMKRFDDIAGFTQRNVMWQNVMQDKSLIMMLLHLNVTG